MYHSQDCLKLCRERFICIAYELRYLCCEVAVVYGGEQSRQRVLAQRGCAKQQHTQAGREQPHDQPVVLVFLAAFMQL